MDSRVRRPGCLLGAALAICVLTQCRKVPFAESYGFLEIASAHWFENEKVAYIFFSLRERSDLKGRGVWQLAYTVNNADGGAERIDFFDIDFGAGVHHHQLVDCGQNRVCGSFSFKSDAALLEAQVRYFYDDGSPLGLEETVAVQNHQSTALSTAYSALPYGVFDQANEHLQVRIHNNFGSPSDDEIYQFGLVRKFAISDPRLTDLAIDDYYQAREVGGGSFAFPSSLCSAGTATDAKVFVGSRAWFDQALPIASPEEGACFYVQFLDKNDAVLLSGDGVGLKNPVADFSNYTFQTPLQKVKQIHTLITYCGTTSSVTDSDFLDYQRFILGMPGREADICLDFGDIDGFEQDLNAHLETRLATALASESGEQDVVFVIAYHQILSSEFFNFHQRLAASLTALIASHESRVSPRLVGALVYDTSSQFRPTSAQRQSLIWCPQELDPLLIASGMADIGSANCMSGPAGDLDLQVINFVAPLGPMPSLVNYTNYVEDFGDKGLAGNPELVFYAAPTSVATRQEKNQRVTFFDNERITLGEAEGMRTCSTRDPREFYGLFDALRFRTADMASSTDSYSIAEIELLWRENETGAEYEIGIAWDLAFWGAVQYTSVLTGQVLSAIPFQQSSRAREVVGDEIWSRTSWPIGEHLEHCRKYCEHPVFDARGAYQPHLAWRDQSDGLCAAPLYPVYKGGA